jgi:peptide/nickel transport system substrate-binding protein
MHTKYARPVVAGLCVALVLALAACGSSKKSSSAPVTPPSGAKKGGHLTVMYAADVDFIDPGTTYYQYGFNVAYALQRPLFSYKPDSLTPVPDLAAAPAKIAPDGKTVTVTIRKGIKFSPPVNREVTNKDVRYALERGYKPGVAGEYLTYLSDLNGEAAFKAGKAKHIAGIELRGKYTIVFKLDRPRAAILYYSLSLPYSAPVPEEYAAKFDAKTPSAYGTHQVTTGPYMIQNDKAGNAIGYKAGQFINLVRNPNWVASTDYKPAYLDSITIKEGVDPAVASRQILNGHSLVNGDFQLPPDVLKSVSTGSKKAQLLISPPTGRFRYIALDSRKKPFDNINVRKAIVAGFNRTALRLAFGGPFVGDIPTHVIPPGLRGFDQAGGTAGPGYDFMSHPDGDLALAAQYMKKAGYPSGRYTGNQTFQAVADGATQQRAVATVAQAEFAKLGFKVKVQFVTRSTMYTKFCQVPSNQPPICPSVGWLKDFDDPESSLDIPFNGKNIIKAGNSNFEEFNLPDVNAAMDKAETIVDPGQRDTAWANIDKLVTSKAPGVLWLWDRQPNLESSNVNGVVNKQNATWDFPWVSLK